jgi:hypothetical protein
MTDMRAWTINDGWILMSVFLTCGERGASLADVIGAADVMNHAIPTSGELSRSLTRLAACGIVIEHAGRFRIADELLPLIAKAKEGKGGLFSIPEKGNKWLSRTRFEADDAVRVVITDEQVASAYESYLKCLRLR